MVFDFLQGLNRPFQVVARVVMTPQTMNEFIGTFQQNLDNYETASLHLATSRRVPRELEIKD